MMDRRAPSPERGDKLWRCSAPSCTYERFYPTRPEPHERHKLFPMRQVDTAPGEADRAPEL
jgi:hypothetical protein